MGYRRGVLYPAVKEVLQSRLGFGGGVTKALDLCRTHCPHPSWDEVAALDFDAERERMLRFWRDVSRRPPPEPVDVLWIAPHDLPTSFNLRGSSRWSRDPDDWKWFYEDDYQGPTYESRVLRRAAEMTESEEPVPKGNRPASDPETVVSLFFSLVLYGLGTKEAARAADGSGLLGGRTDRWFVVGHPDAVYGVILGRLSPRGWHGFKG